MSTKSLLNTAESWEKIYKAFENINFTAYDFEAVKQSLLNYLKIQYPENFNDYIDSSQLIALIETFAYTAEILAYRVDLSIHENLLPTATRKQSILRLVKLTSYTASRNLPLRGLVKITSISTSENLLDSQGNNLSNRFVNWNDQNNSLWREQFFAIANKVLTQNYGNPFKSFQIDDTVFQQYEVKNILETEAINSSFQNGIIKTKVNVSGQDLKFELVPADINNEGVFERDPNPNSYFTLLYADDSYGDGSDTTGFMMYMKQGSLQKLPYVFDTNLPNRSIDINIPNINDSDVWVQQVSTRGVITDTWQAVPNVAGVNLVFNNIANTKKYEIETLENDQIRLIFGDGDFAAMPTGIFNIWVRSSESGNINVQKSLVTNKSMTFAYTSKKGTIESCTFNYSLTSVLQNSAVTEDIAHIKSVAPSVYYTQNRMVNGQDYNSYLLQDPSILRLNAVNRTFAGQPKYINWNDASGSYQNVKIFGNDLRLYYDTISQTQVSTISSRSLIDDIIEPYLSLPGIYNLLIYSAFKTPLSMGPSSAQVSINPFVKPRFKFIEGGYQSINGVSLQEKTNIQAYLDKHWYGEADSIVQLDANLSDVSSLPKSAYAVVSNDFDHLIWDYSIKCVTKNSFGLYTLIPTSNGASGIQESTTRQKRFGIKFTPNTDFTSTLTIDETDTIAPGTTPLNESLNSIHSNSAISTIEDVYTIEIINSNGSFTVHSANKGYQANGIVGENYDNGILHFKIGDNSSPGFSKIIPGDAFVVYIDLVDNIFKPFVKYVNLSGNFNLISDIALTNEAINSSYDPIHPVNSWIFIIERTDDLNGNTAYWNITRRNFNLVAESISTKFWYNQDMQIVDPATQNPVTDLIRILKSNLNSNTDPTKLFAIGTDLVYSVVSDVKYSNGEVNPGALNVTASNTFSKIDTASGTLQDPLKFLSFIGLNDYVYFLIDQSTGKYTPVVATSYITHLVYDQNGISGNYARKLGRDNLDFMWQHFTPNDNLIDPSTSNIVDIYVLTNGYYTQIQEYVNDLISIEPIQPSPLELRNSYSKLLGNKMISDTVIMHSGKVKFIFGNKATPELRVKFKIVISPNAKLTGDQIRSRVLEIINAYFSIDNWDFGQSFYATELNAVIHKQLSTEISSIVMVPEFPTNHFGDLFYLRTSSNEVFVSCVTLDNIEIVSSIDRLTLKQKQ